MSNTDTHSDSKRLLVRSGWQTHNIGDVAHTPGLLSLIEQHIPGCEVWLWSTAIHGGVAEMLEKRFSDLRIIRGDDDLSHAFRVCGALIHGSGPYVVAERDVRQWRDQTGKPYGFYGITLPHSLSSFDPEASPAELEQTLAVLNEAAFVYYRDSPSLERAMAIGVSSPVQDFGPDAAFAVDLDAAEQANTFLDESRLEPGRFVCCIPRNRHTPGWKPPRTGRPFDPEKDEINTRFLEHDHRYLVETIEAIVSQTGYRVLICAEDGYQVSLGRTAIYDHLSAAAREQVVWRDSFWTLGEAVGIYKRSAGLFGLEMHSPIMCIGNGVPAVVCRFDEQTTKGFMWEDIGLANWLFDVDDEDRMKTLGQTVLEIVKEPETAQRKTMAALEFVRTRQAATMETVSGLVSAEWSPTG